MIKSDWLRGGFIGLAVITLIFISFVFPRSLNPSSYYNSHPLILSIFLNPLADMNAVFYESFGKHLIYNTENILQGPTISGLIVIGTIYFIIGSFLGWIYGKIKSRNNIEVI